MLTVTIFLPLALAALVLALPNARSVRWIAFLGSLTILTLALVMAFGFSPAGAALHWRDTAPWIPSIGASYDVALSGVSLGLFVLTAFLMSVVMAFLLDKADHAGSHAALFLLLETGLLGLFSAQDLLLFYLFFEVALVPMYFIIGIWGGERRHYAALKFFLYTRIGSLSMLLGLLTLALSMRPHSFSLPAIIAAHPLGATPGAAAFAFFALFLGFGVKLPTVPLHNWLPDAHVDAPTEGSVVLAGLQLKMGGYGLIAILLPCLPHAAQRFAWVAIALGVASLLYAALLSLVQGDMKRLIAFTSINHLGYVSIAVGIAGAVADPAIGRFAVNGAVVQMISHGLLTGGMFLLIGLVQHRAGTRELSDLRGISAAAPALGVLFALLAFGSLGLPGLSGFIAELQVIGGAIGLSWWLAAAIVLALVLMTAVYLRLIASTLMGEASEAADRLAGLPRSQLLPVAALAIGSLLIGIAPGPLITAIDSGTRLLLR